MIDVISMPLPCNDRSLPASASKSPPADAETDQLSKLRAGDERAFEELVRRYTPRFMAVAARFLRSAEDRADAVQDAFLCAFRSLGSFEGKSRLSTWLYRIVVNACLSKLRSQSRAAVMPLDDLVSLGDESCRFHEPVAPSRAPALSKLSSAETRVQVRQCIDRLPESYRTVLVLRDLEELDTNQTARTIGVTRAAVKTRLHRARRVLRDLLAPLVGV